ncbi:MAG: pseudouridine synthase [Acetomicrobium sp.]
MKEMSLKENSKNRNGAKYNESVRLNKYLAMCGLGSRRKVEKLIAEGRVKIDGQVAPGPWVTISSDTKVAVDERTVVPLKKVYIAMNKPRNYVCAVTDARYKTVLDLLPKELRDYHLFPVGRLDKNSTGLLILTNDGEFANNLIHPRNNITKTYEVVLDKPIAQKDIVKWKKGLRIDRKFIRPKSVKTLAENCCEVEIYEGVKREVRRMAEILGYKVIKLTRTKIGNLQLKTLKEGSFLKLQREELSLMIRNGGVI